jgi:hypothetical protein
VAWDDHRFHSPLFRISVFKKDDLASNQIPFKSQYFAPVPLVLSCTEGTTCQIQNLFCNANPWEEQRVPGGDHSMLHGATTPQPLAKLDPAD